jgi:2-oxoglutarate ferredoxin oxidoreductase subunit gamma
MEHSVVFAGFGGQGALFAGQLLTHAAADAGLHVTWIPSYGPEMRGGTANCTVVIGDVPIGSPLVRNPDMVVAMNLPSTDKYEPLLKSGGLLIVNGSLVKRPIQRSDIDAIVIPANDIAEELGNAKAANVVLLGAFSSLLGHDVGLWLEIIRQRVPPKYMDLNEQAFRRGRALIEKQ